MTNTLLQWFMTFNVFYSRKTLDIPIFFETLYPQILQWRERTWGNSFKNYLRSIIFSLPSLIRWWLQYQNVDLYECTVADHLFKVHRQEPYRSRIQRLFHLRLTITVVSHVTKFVSTSSLGLLRIKFRINYWYNSVRRVNLNC